MPEPYIACRMPLSSRTFNSRTPEPHPIPCQLTGGEHQYCAVFTCAVVVKRAQQPVVKVAFRSLFKEHAGEVQEEAKAEEYLAYMWV